jgi:hypothetical protein
MPMSRSRFAVIGVALVTGLAAWVRTSRDHGQAQLVAASNSATATSTPTPTATATPTSTPTPTSTATATSTSTPDDDEAALMDRLRAADPAMALVIAREGNRRFPNGARAEERAACIIDALVALDRIGEAHSDAMLFVQHHPTGPFSARVMNLMGVHPRPPGAVPEPPSEAADGR